MDRRTALGRLAPLGAALLAACGRGGGGPEAGDRKKENASMASATTNGGGQTMPAIFLAHGSPLLLDDAQWVAELGRWGSALPRPKAILTISAHWTDAPVAIGATTTVPLVYDFYGFDRKYYELQYPAPGAPALADRVRALLSPAEKVIDAPKRGLDHGAYVPLVAMYPKADVPVLQVSMPTLDPQKLLALGRALAPLRDEGVLIVGSGFLTHNMRAIDWRPGAKPPAWATEFDAWAGEALAERDVDTLAKYLEIGPNARMALPTVEHFVPVFVALGASMGRAEQASFPITGFTYGSFTKRSVQLG
jgi:4,5-DOPA dioxygenase extradiol